MKQNTKTNIYYLTEAGIIAALYFVLTFASNAAGLAYGQIQFRLSEVLCILPVFTPAAIPGLVIGCLLSNLLSPMGWADWVFGTGATLLAALATYFLRKLKWKKLPVLSALMPTLFNGIIVGLEIAIFLPEGTRFVGFGYSFLFVALGELVTATFGGLFLYRLLEKYQFPFPSAQAGTQKTRSAEKETALPKQKPTESERRKAK